MLARLLSPGDCDDGDGRGGDDDGCCGDDGGDGGGDDGCGDHGDDDCGSLASAGLCCSRCLHARCHQVIVMMMMSPGDDGCGDDVCGGDGYVLFSAQMD